MHFRPGMCLIVPTLPVDLADCAAEPVPPLHLVDAEAKCGHLRQDAPDAYLSCINEVAFTNEMRIESRQRYLNDAATEVFASAPVPPAPAPFVPEPADSMMLPTSNPYGYLRHPPQSSSASVRSPYLGAATRMAYGWAASNRKRAPGTVLTPRSRIRPMNLTSNRIPGTEARKHEG